MLNTFKYVWQLCHRQMCTVRISLEKLSIVFWLLESIDKCRYQHRKTSMIKQENFYIKKQKNSSVYNSVYTLHSNIFIATLKCLHSFTSGEIRISTIDIFQRCLGMCFTKCAVLEKILRAVYIHIVDNSSYQGRTQTFKCKYSAQEETFSNMAASVSQGDLGYEYFQ